jgi:uncharacterized OsmC-like protein
MAAKIRLEVEELHITAEGDLDRRGRRGTADVLVHFQAVRVHIKIRTDAQEKKLQRLKELVARYCPVDSLIRAAVADYNVVWERMQ